MMVGVNTRAAIKHNGTLIFERGTKSCLWMEIKCTNIGHLLLSWIFQQATSEIMKSVTMLRMPHEIVTPVVES